MYVSLPRFFAASLLALVIAQLLRPSEVSAAGVCRFKSLRPVVLKTMGPCNFDPVSKKFAGTPAEQAACLMTPVLEGGKIATPLENLPVIFAKHVGLATGLPARQALFAALQSRGFENALGFNFAQPVARVADEGNLEPSASYFVMHDTSSPNYRGRTWPDNLNENPKINNLENYSCSNNIERAHVFINRRGDVLLGHDLEVPWRATKFESAVNFGLALKGLFLHVELIQPRRRHPGFRGQNDFLAPDPGFSQAQYDALAFVYVFASVRAGKWLIPAFHAVIDEGIYDKHDDPQNFELTKFAQSTESLIATLNDNDNTSGSANRERHSNQ